MLEEKFDFLKDFDYVILSYEEGIKKPELLKKVLEKTDYQPGEILLLDDGEEIIKEASKMGFKTILCENADKIEEYLTKLDIPRN